MSELTEFFVRHYTLVLDNEEGTHRAVTKLAREVVVGSLISRSKYAAMTQREREDEYADAIGERVADFIDVEAADEYGRMPMIVSEIMMNHSSDVERRLGEHYTPELADVEDYLDDDENECEGHDSLSGPIGETVYCDGTCTMH